MAEKDVLGREGFGKDALLSTHAATCTANPHSTVHEAPTRAAGESSCV